MGRNGTKLLPIVLAAAWAVFCATDARATLVLCESELSVPAEIPIAEPCRDFLGADPSCRADIFHKDLAARLRIDLSEIVGDSWLFWPPGAAGLPSEPAGDERRREDERDRQERLLEVPRDAASSMSPSPTLAQGSSSGPSSALPGNLVPPPQSAIQAALPPEARTILPTGPPWYWFRPPR